MARFGQSFINSLTNPSYADQMTQVGMLGGSLMGRHRKAEEEREKFQNTVANQQQFIRAEQSGDARLAAESSNKLMELATKSQDSDLANVALKQQAEVAGIRQRGALKGIANIDRALADPNINSPTLGPNAKDALTQRREELLQDPDTARAYEAMQQKQKEEETKRLKNEADLALKQEKVSENKTNNQVRAATTALLGGATPEKMAQAFPPSVIRDAQVDVTKYQKALLEAQDLLDDNTPLTGNEPAFLGLDETSRNAVLQTQAAGGSGAPRRARALLADYIKKTADDQLTASQDRREQMANIDKETIKTQYLNDRDSEWKMDENVSEWYRSQDQDMRDELSGQFDELFDMGIWQAQQRKLDGEDVNIKKAAIDFVNEQMVARYNIDLRPQQRRDEIAALESQLIEKFRELNPTWSEKRLKDTVQAEVNRRVGQRKMEDRKVGSHYLGR